MIASTFALALLSTAPQAPALRPRWKPDKSLSGLGASLVVSSEHGRHPRRVVVKLADDSGVTVAAGALVSRETNDAVDLVGVFDAIVRPLLDVDRATLATWRAAGQHATGRELADLSQLFLIELSHIEDRDVLIANLLELDEVELAYAAPLAAPSPGDVPAPATPDFSGFQGHNLAAPGGLDSDAANTAGQRGAGVDLIDLEYRWNHSHEDLARPGAPSHLGPAPVAPIGWSGAQWNAELDHGTAVLGVLSADVDAFGVSGMAPDARVRTVAANTSGGYNVAGAIALAISNLGRGDVILVEQQAFGPNPGGFVPVEYNLAEFLAIQQATALGIHVVEAAGNGFQNLDASSGADGHPSYPQLFDIRVRNSGAQLVGAATSGTSSHQRLPFSNIGLRVDSYAWGENVWTLGYGPGSPSLLSCPDPFPAGAGDVNQWYAMCFSGTSSASAQIAAATAIVEGAHGTLHGSPLKPEALRLLFHTSGVLSGDWNVAPIGRQPDLAEALAILDMGPQPGPVTSGFFGGDHLGFAVAALGDVDGDGVADYVAGAPDHGFAPTDFGLAKVTSGLSGNHLRTLVGSIDDGRFGTAVGSTPDADGDGLADLLVGAPQAQGGRGEVFVYANPAMSSSYWSRVLGPTAGERFGDAVLGPGDLTSDGNPDVLVGAPRSDPAATDAGRVYLFRSNGFGLIANGSIDGAAAHDRFGASLAALGDVDGDGVSDFAVGAPQDSATSPGTGRVRVYSGASSTLLLTLSGEATGDAFGAAVAPAGDVDRDGTPDVLVGAPGNDFAASDTGRAYVFSGADGTRLLTLTGPAPGARFGAAVAGGRDANGDRRGDLFVGAPGSHGSKLPGSATLFDATGRILDVYRGNAVRDRFGTSVDMLEDLDGDGRDDLLVGSPFDDLEFTDNGRAYVFYGRATRTAPAGAVATTNGSIGL